MGTQIKEEQDRGPTRTFESQIRGQIKPSSVLTLTSMNLNAILGHSKSTVTQKSESTLGKTGPESGQRCCDNDSEHDQAKTFTNVDSGKFMSSESQENSRRSARVPNQPKRDRKSTRLNSSH